MIYLVSAQPELFTHDDYTVITAEESLKLMAPWWYVQFDTETKGVDAHIVPVLCAQFGNKESGHQVVVDTSTVDLKLYKEFLEERVVIGQNLYFDLQFLFNYGIVPLNVYDTMIVEQLLYLGFPYLSVTPEMYAKYGFDFPYRATFNEDTGKEEYFISFSLQALVKKYKGIYLDKSVRGNIIYRGLDLDVIRYAANDVVHLEDIMEAQIKRCEELGCLEAARIECYFVPVLAYVSWCGIKLDVDTWSEKMAIDSAKLDEAIKKLNDFVVQRGDKEYIDDLIEFSLFEDVSEEPKSKLKFMKPGMKAPKGSKEVIMKFVKSLGFDLRTIDKKTKRETESLDLKLLKKQKGVCDDFLIPYIEYSKAYKVCSTYGITYINAINPLTGRIHTQFKQLAADTGRVACGNDEEEEKIKINPDLAKLKGMPLKTDDITQICGYPNIQTLPNDPLTRKAFVSEKGNLFCSCDWSAIESRLGADIYEEQAMINEFLYGSGDMHSLVAKMVFPELKDVPVKEIKDKYPKLRSAAKPIEFSQQFGGSAEAIRNSMGCSVEEAEKFAKAYNEGFKGIAKFKQKGAKFVRDNGYIILNPLTGHRTFWWDWQKWKAIEASHDKAFWEDYRINHKGTKDAVCKEVSLQFQAASKWERKALNSVTQGTGAICLKVAMRTFLEWIVNNNLFGVVKIVDLVHDECCCEFPETMPEVGKLLEDIMKDTAAIYCKSLPIPAVAETNTFWVH